MLYYYVFQGAGSHASSGTTHPPSFVAVAARGEWSIGKVLDVYFKFGLGGDQYLGRILAFLDPNLPEFSVLPPHWKDKKSPNVIAGLELNFPHLMKHRDTQHDPTGLLQLMLASLVFHSDWLNKQRANNPRHPFASIPILNDVDLLKALKEEVTLEPNKDVRKASGVPPHVEHAKALKEVLDVCTTMSERVEQFSDRLDASVASAIDKKVAVEGGLNMTIFREEVARLKMELVGEMKAVTFTRAPNPTINNEIVDVEVDGKFLYNRYVWDVPESFQFPSPVNRWDGWRMWLKGYVFILPSGKTCEIKPFRYLGTEDFASATNKNDFKTGWRPIFQKMMEAPGLNVPAADAEKIDNAVLKDSFDHATTYLRQQFSFLFQNENSTWNISTWSKKVGRSYVAKHGTQADILKLPPATRRNVKHFNRQPALPFKRRGFSKKAAVGTNKRVRAQLFSV